MSSLDYLANLALSIPQGKCKDTLVELEGQLKPVINTSSNTSRQQQNASTSSSSKNHSRWMKQVREVLNTNQYWNSQNYKNYNLHHSYSSEEIFSRLCVQIFTHTNTESNFISALRANLGLAWDNRLEYLAKQFFVTAQTAAKMDSHKFYRNAVHITTKCDYCSQWTGILITDHDGTKAMQEIHTPTFLAKIPFGSKFDARAIYICSLLLEDNKRNRSLPIPCIICTFATGNECEIMTIPAKPIDLKYNSGYIQIKRFLRNVQPFDRSDHSLFLKNLERNVFRDVSLYEPQIGNIEVIDHNGSQAMHKAGFKSFFAKINDNEIIKNLNGIYFGSISFSHESYQRPSPFLCLICKKPDRLPKLPNKNNNPINNTSNSSDLSQQQEKQETVLKQVELLSLDNKSKENDSEVDTNDLTSGNDNNDVNDYSNKNYNDNIDYDAENDSDSTVGEVKNIPNNKSENVDEQYEIFSNLDPNIVEIMLIPCEPISKQWKYGTLKIESFIRSFRPFNLSNYKNEEQYIKELTITVNEDIKSIPFKSSDNWIDFQITSWEGAHAMSEIKSPTIFAKLSKECLEPRGVYYGMMYLNSNLLTNDDNNNNNDNNNNDNNNDNGNNNNNNNNGFYTTVNPIPITLAVFNKGDTCEIMQLPPSITPKNIQYGKIKMIRKLRNIRPINTHLTDRKAFLNELTSVINEDIIIFKNQCC